MMLVGVVRPGGTLAPLYERTLESHAAYIMAQDAPTELKMGVVVHLHMEIKKIEQDHSALRTINREIPIALYLLEKER